MASTCFLPLVFVLVELFFQLALDDVRGAARELRAVYDASGGRDGFVSFECTPDLADNADATIAQALDAAFAATSYMLDAF